jgi:hypothetical protein
MSKMPKLDLKKEYREFYNASAKSCSVVDVPEMQFLMVDGSGDPNTSQAYQDAVGALYAMAYTLKFLSKQTEKLDYVVMPLEGLWWTDDMAGFSAEDKSAWKWTAMIMQPDHITSAQVEASREEVRNKKNPPALDRLRFESLREGLSVQIMHIGPYADEGPTIARLHQFAADSGYSLRGKHHEIYLSDPRRAAPERLRTVIRQPVAAASQ